MRNRYGVSASQQENEFHRPYHHGAYLGAPVSSRYRGRGFACILRRADSLHQLSFKSFAFGADVVGLAEQNPDWEKLKDIDVLNAEFVENKQYIFNKIHLLTKQNF